MLYTNIDFAPDGTGVELGNSAKYPEQSYALRVNGAPIKNGFNENKGAILVGNPKTGAVSNASIADASENTFNCLLLTTCTEKTIESNGYVQYVGEAPAVIAKGTLSYNENIFGINHYDYFLVPVGDVIIKILESWSSAIKYIAYVDGKFDMFEASGYREPVSIFRKKHPEATELIGLLSGHKFKSI